MLNPYAQHLGDRDPLEVIASTAEKLRRSVTQLGRERAEQPPAPGKWSAREIACHLADCEIAFGFRLRQTLAEENVVVQPFDQEKWAQTYAGYSLDDALAMFEAARAWNVALIRKAGPGAYGKKLTHPERGEMTFKTLVETMAGHDLNHLKQVEAIAAKGAAA
jgi:hypothetical protein